MNKLGLRSVIASAICAAAMILTLGGSDASAQNRRIIVPYTPGSGPDILARLLADQIGAQNGPNFVVENRPGGGVVIGTEVAARAEPDGNTVLLAGNSFVVNAAARRGNYGVAAFEPVCYLAATPIVFVVQGSAPYRTLADVVAAAKQKPGSISFASGGPGSVLHLAIEVLRGATGIDIAYVPYGGTLPAINALMGGHVQVVAADYPTVVAQIKAGTVRGLAIASAKRSTALPDVPTLNETGLAKLDAEVFYAVVAPAKTPAPAVKQLTDSFLTALKAPALQPKLAQQGLFPVGTCGAPFGEFLSSSVAAYERIIKDAHLQLN
jgi:tripartite-type tricarboxylate transporter receptor subunit TctC